MPDRTRTCYPRLEMSILSLGIPDIVIVPRNDWSGLVRLCSSAFWWFLIPASQKNNADNAYCVKRIQTCRLHRFRHAAVARLARAKQPHNCGHFNKPVCYLSKVHGFALDVLTRHMRPLWGATVDRC